MMSKIKILTGSTSSRIETEKTAPREAQDGWCTHYEGESGRYTLEMR